MRVTLLSCVLSHMLFVSGLLSAPKSNTDRELINTDSPVPIRDIDKWQTGPYCGVNCLYFLLALVDKDVSLESLRNTMSVQSNGASMQELQDTAHSHGVN